MAQITFDIYQLITAIGLFLIVLCIVMMLSNKKGNFTANLIFSFFLIPISLIICDSGIILYTGLYYYIPHFAKIPTVTQLLDGPLLYLYLLVLTQGKEKLNRYTLLHFIPFVLYVFLYSHILFQSGDAKIEYVYAWLNGTVSMEEMIREGILFGIILMHILFYLFLSLRYIITYEKKLLTVYANKKMFFSWLKLFIYFFITTIVVTVIFTVGVIVFDMRFSIVYRILPIITTASICVVAFFVAIQSDIHIGIDVSGQIRNADQHPLLPESEVKRIVLMVNRVMKQEKIFKEADLTLSDLATKVGIKRNQMSYILNNYFRENFYDYVNRHRIEEVKQILATTGNDDINFLNIGFAVGFNSKTTFNTSFKKITNMSPSEYRKLWFSQQKTG